MKTFVLFLIMVLAIATSCNRQKNDTLTTTLITNPLTASGNSDLSDEPVIEMYENNFDFGVIIQGEKVSHVFKFRNKGKKDLIIGDVTASCGCTVPKFSTEPIKSGQEGQVEVIFNSSGRSGKQIKHLTIYANTTPNKTQITFTADVIVPDKKN